MTIFQILISKRNLRKKKSRREPEAALFAVISNSKPFFVFCIGGCAHGGRGL